MANRNLGENILNPLDDSSQFSKARLVNHGELEDGEIPEALRYSRNCETGVLKNGVRVATESFASPLSNLTIAVKSGVRNENIKNNGVGYFIEKLFGYGTAGRSQGKLHTDLNNLGAFLSVEAGRELTTINVSFLTDTAPQVFEIVGDVLTKSAFNKNHIEEVRE
jgi:predicted Zn-dependent peptidase